MIWLTFVRSKINCYNPHWHCLWLPLSTRFIVENMEAQLLSLHGLWNNMCLIIAPERLITQLGTSTYVLTVSPIHYKCKPLTCSRDRHIMLFKLSKILFLNIHDRCLLFSQNQPITLKNVYVALKNESNSIISSWIGLLLALEPKYYNHMLYYIGFSEELEQPSLETSWLSEWGTTWQKGHGHLVQDLKFLSTWKGLLFSKKFLNNVCVPARSPVLLSCQTYLILLGPLSLTYSSSSAAVKPKANY